MPKRKRDDELRELRQKVKKLERDNRSRSSFRRIRVISSSSDSSPTHPASRHHSQSQQRSPSATVSASSAAKHVQDTRAKSKEARRGIGTTDIVVQAQVHNIPRGSHAAAAATSVQGHAHPTTSSCEITSEAQGLAASAMDDIILPYEETQNPDCTNDIVPDTPVADTLVEELSSDILEILGDDPSVPKIFGKDIQKDLAIRFNHTATNGLSKELRKELREKYPVPANCTLIDAPQINPEVKAAISDTISKRLYGMEQKQKQLASAISCLGEAITLLIGQNNADPNLLRLLMDAGRIICDTQYSDSLTRRFFILNSLKKEMKDQLLLTKIDSFLFGNNLSETLKSAKAITKSGAELKPNYASNSTKQTTWKSNFNKPPFKKNNLNTRTPPQSHRSTTGSSRPRAPAPRNQPVSSSRNYRPTFKRNHR